MARKPTSQEDAEKRIAEFIENSGIMPGVHNHNRSNLDHFKEYGMSGFASLYMKFGGDLWANEASVDVNFRYSSYKTDEDVNIYPEVTVNWSSTHRSVAAANAALVAYQEAVDFASRIEALLQELMPIVRFADKKEEEEVNVT